MLAKLITIYYSHFIKRCIMSKLSVIITVHTHCARDPEQFTILELVFPIE